MCEFTDAGKLIEYQYDLIINILPYSYDASTQKLSTGAFAILSKVETLTATELVIITENSSAGALTSKFVYKRKYLLSVLYVYLSKDTKICQIEGDLIYILKFTIYRSK